MKIEKLTIKSQQALQAAQSAAVEGGHAEIQPEHLLHALLNQEDGLVPVLLNRVGADVDRLRRRVRELLEAMPRVEGGVPPHPGDPLRLLVEDAERRAVAFHDDFVSVEHLLLSLMERHGPAFR